MPTVAKESQNYAYIDNIISLFHDDIDRCTEPIKTKEDSGSTKTKDSITIQSIKDIVENDIPHTDKEWERFDISINYCYESLNIMSDLMKLKIFSQNCDDFDKLLHNIETRFIKSQNSAPFNSRGYHFNNIHDLMNNKGYNGWKYKDNSIRCIQRCNKLLLSINSLSLSLSDIRDFIQSNMDDVLRDSMTLLLQLWFYLNQQIKLFKFKIMTLFIEAKCLLINFELNLLLDYLKYGSDKGVNLQFKPNAQINLQNTLYSFNIFIKGLIESLNIAEKSNNDKIFDESFQIFIDIESMYNQLNFDWLIQTRTYSSRTTEEFLKTDNDQDLIDDSRKLKRISHYVDNSINNNRQTNKVIENDDKNNDDFSLTKELPYLLSAFNNVKKLEDEIVSSINFDFTYGDSQRRNIDQPKRTEPVHSPRPSLDSNLNTPVANARDRTHSMSSSNSTASTLYSRDVGTGNYMNTISTTATTTATTVGSSTLFSEDNTKESMNFKNTFSLSLNPPPVATSTAMMEGLSSNMTTSQSSPNPSTTQLDPIHLIPPKLATAPSSASLSTTFSSSAILPSQLLKNDLTKLMNMQEQTSPIKPLNSKRSFNHSTIDTRNLDGFHSSILNNLYGVGNKTTKGLNPAQTP